MDNIKQLERAWYRYKLKGITSVVGSLAFVSLLGTGSYYSLSKIQLSKNILETHLPVIALKSKTEEIKGEQLLVKKVVETKVTALNESMKVTSDEKPKIQKKELYEVSLEPVIPIVDMKKEERKRVVAKRKYRAPKTAHPRPIVRKSSKIVRAKAANYLTASELATINNSMDTQKLKKINLHSSSVNYIETMQKKFHKSKNPRDALLLAKAYYSKKSYAKSEEWALKANKLDNSLEESWYLFAKSKAKRGQKTEAIKILSSFYKKSHKPKTKILIAKIKTERL